MKLLFILILAASLTILRADNILLKMGNDNLERQLNQVKAEDKKIRIQTMIVGLRYPSKDGDEKKTRLLEACSSGSLEEADRLLSNGVDANAATKNGTSALMLASYQYLPIVRLLINKGALVNSSTVEGWTPLTSAVSYCQDDIVKLLIEHGADVNAKYQKGNQSLLMMAAERGATSIVEALLSHGASLEEQDDEGNTALIHAVEGPEDSEGGDISTVKLLLDAEADVNARNKKGWSALVLAGYLGNVEMISVLVERGANINLQDNEGWTALMLAAYDGHTDAAAALLRNGADTSLINKENKTALHYAIDRKQDEIIGLLKQHHK